MWNKEMHYLAAIKFFPNLQMIPNLDAHPKMLRKEMLYVHAFIIWKI